MIPLIKSIALLYGFKPGDKWPMLMMGGLVYVGSTSYLILPYKSLPLIVFASYESTTGRQQKNNIPGNIFRKDLIHSMQPFLELKKGGTQRASEICICVFHCCAGASDYS